MANNSPIIAITAKVKQRKHTLNRFPTPQMKRNTSYGSG